MTISAVSSPARRFLLLVIAGFLAASAVGIFWEVRIQPSNAAIMTHPDGSMSTLVRTEQRRLFELFGLSSSVHDVALDGIVIVPDDRSLDRFLLENLAQVDVVVDTYDPVLSFDPTEMFDSNETLRGVGRVVALGDPTPWVVVWQSSQDAPRTLKYFTRGETVVLVDEQLIGTP